MMPLKKFNMPHSGGLFGAVRKHDIHTGIDLYCHQYDDVFAIEDGIVINICPFTGEKAGSVWWNETDAILIKGKSGVILYGELQPLVKVGVNIKEGDLIGKILRVFKKDKGLPMDMLHLELYDSEYIGDGEIWNINQEMPKLLKDPNILINERD